MKKYKIYLLFLFLIFSCISSPKIPENVLSKEKMVKVLVDVHILESNVSQIALRSLDSSYTLEKVLEQDVFKKNNTDSLTYNRSFRFYLSYPEYMEQIYSAVVDTLTEREKQLGKKMPPALPPKNQNIDSLKNKLQKPLQRI